MHIADMLISCNSRHDVVSALALVQPQIDDWQGKNPAAFSFTAGFAPWGAILFFIFNSPLFKIRKVQLVKIVEVSCDEIVIV